MESKELLKAADVVEKFCDFIHPDIHKRTIFYARFLAQLMRQAANNEHPPFWEDNPKSATEIAKKFKHQHGLKRGDVNAGDKEVNG